MSALAKRSAETMRAPFSSLTLSQAAAKSGSLSERNYSWGWRPQREAIPQFAGSPGSRPRRGQSVPPHLVDVYFPLNESLHFLYISVTDRSAKLIRTRLPALALGSHARRHA
jgi:hypothetical protein